jgi:hypothetical protein
MCFTLPRTYNAYTLPSVKYTFAWHRCLASTNEYQFSKKIDNERDFGILFLVLPVIFYTKGLIVMVTKIYFNQD